MPGDKTHLQDYADRLRLEAGSPDTDPIQVQQARFWADAISGLVNECTTEERDETIDEAAVPEEDVAS